MTTLPDPLTAGDPIADVPQWTLDMRLALVGAPDGLLYDTGWVDVPVRNGFSQQASNSPQVRRIGAVVHARWGWSNTGMTPGGAHIVGDLPVGFRPSQTCYFPAGSSSANTGMFVIYSNGNVEIRPGSTLSNYYLFPSHTPWLID